MNVRKIKPSTLIILLIMVSLLGCGQDTNELAGTEWELVTLNGKELIADTAISLYFAEEYLGGQMGCNGYGGTSNTGKYQAKSDGTFALGSPFAVTVQRCTDPYGIMEQEAEYIETLMNATRFQLKENRLEIKDEAGEIMLVYQQR
jgi:heat shock protein HslJ